MQVHVLSIEGPDPNLRAGGLATRANGLCETIGAQPHDVHLWFVGDPDAPVEESRESLRLHRWCQGISRFQPGVACTECSGEGYAAPGQITLVLETGDPLELIGLYERLLSSPKRRKALRRAGLARARRHAWPEVVNGVLIPRLRLAPSIPFGVS